MFIFVHIENAAATDFPNLNAIDVTVSLKGVRAERWEDFVPLYKKHAATVGFNIRKSTQRVDGGKIYEKYLVCSCGGHPPVIEIDLENPAKKRKISDTKTNCKANLRIKLEDGFYIVESHNMLHNHPLTRPGWQYMHRSERSISQEKGEAMKVMDKAGIKPSAAYSYFVHNAGGEEQVGHTQKDHLNFVNRERLAELDGNDAQVVLDELYRRQRKDPGFYFKPLLGLTGKLEALYWRDSDMRLDYEAYSEILIFDTTYKTNRYDLICAPFVGVNNHWNTVMFACAFIKDEKTTTFEWLFREFLESMDQKKPVTIFTDQDSAMAAAIKTVFGKETRHRLCLWHIHKNATSNCGKLKQNKEFNIAFDHCLRGCNDRLEFENCWVDMITKFHLQDDSWFKRLYGIKEKWCTALSKDFFSAGILSSQRSESTNNAISFKATKTTSLAQFLTIFTQTVERWRSKEKNNEFKCSRSTPRSRISTGLLKHGANVYTATIYYFFEVEFETCLVSNAVVELNLGAKKTYLVSLEGDDDPKNARLVTCVMDKEKVVEICCTCKFFEEVGWLCSHCLRVLFVTNVTRIPERYIKKRWTKDAKKHVWDRIEEERQKVQGDDRIYWREFMCRRFCDLVLKSEGNMDSRKMLEDAYTTNALAIEVMNSQDVTESSNADMEDESFVGERALDPDRATTKRRRGKQKKTFGRRKATTAKYTFTQPRNEHLI